MPISNLELKKKAAQRMQNENALHIKSKVNNVRKTEPKLNIH